MSCDRFQSEIGGVLVVVNGRDAGETSSMASDRAWFVATSLSTGSIVTEAEAACACACACARMRVWTDHVGCSFPTVDDDGGVLKR